MKVAGFSNTAVFEREMGGGGGDVCVCKCVCVCVCVGGGNRTSMYMRERAYVCKRSVCVRQGWGASVCVCV